MDRTGGVGSFDSRSRQVLRALLPRPLSRADCSAVCEADLAARSAVSPSLPPFSNSSLAAKARALMEGRYHVTEDDLRVLALPVLRHRVLTNYQAESDGRTADEILREVIQL